MVLRLYTFRAIFFRNVKMYRDSVTKALGSVFLASAALTLSSLKGLDEGLNGLFMDHTDLYAQQCNLYKCKNWNIRLINVIKTYISKNAFIKNIILLHIKYNYCTGIHTAHL